MGWTYPPRKALRAPVDSTGDSSSSPSCSLTLQNVFRQEAVKNAVARYDLWAYSTVGTQAKREQENRVRSSARSLLASGRNRPNASGRDKSHASPIMNGSMPVKELRRRRHIKWLEIRPGVLSRQWTGLSTVPQVDLCPQGQMHAYFNKDEVHEAKYFCAPEKLMTDRSCRIVSIGSNNQ